MIAKRLLPVVMILGLTHAEAAGQYAPPEATPPGYAAPQSSLQLPVAPPTYAQPESPLFPASGPPPGRPNHEVPIPEMPPPSTSHLGHHFDAFGPVANATYTPGTVLSPWVATCPEGCNGPFGRHGPIGTEIYFRTGISVPIGGDFYKDRTQVGWNIAGGGRTLLFTPEMDRAWTFDFGIDYTYNNGGADPVGFEIILPVEPGNPNTTGIERVSLRGLHRTAVRLTAGHEWWIWGPAYGAPGPTWRAGADVGGYLGTAHVDLNGPGEPPNDYRRFHDVIGGSILGLHTRFEIPFDGWLLMLGGRFEWRYNRLDMIETQDGNFHDATFLFDIGLRF